MNHYPDTLVVIPFYEGDELSPNELRIMELEQRLLSISTLLQVAEGLIHAKRPMASLTSIDRARKLAQLA